MRLKIKLLFLVSVLLYSFYAKGQVELQKIAPLSPNAAAITKYGEIPVGHFTGAANISIPLYTIQSKELSLPLSLSYHGGGIKVEENASWVGLGWSLGTIPTISRQVNGLADELGVGYNSTITYDGYSMKEIEDSVILSATESWVESFRRQIFYGDVDPEADIYFFSLLDKSGKFWWNQETSSFQTYPKSEIKIELLGGTFRITDENGTVYVFYDYELSQSAGSSSAPALPSAWYANKIYNANRTDSINFSYGSSSTSSIAIAPYTYTLFGSCPSSDLTYTTSVSIKFPDSIWFNNGYVKFNIQGSSREDYDGGYALDNIKIHSNYGGLIKQYNFSYHYMESSDNSGLCNTATSFEKKRLMLDEVDLVDGSNVSGSKHSFLYDSTIVSPCKVSAAQDYWGFYNGEMSNSNLIPRTAKVLTSGPQIVGSADRNVYSAYSQFGVLRRVVYPTGGYSDFEYENNTAGNNPSLPAAFTVMSVALQGEAPDPISTDTYIDTFTVNNVANTHLNGNLGGAFLYAEISAYGCDLSGGSSPCASFTIRGIDAGNSSYFGTVLPGNTQGWHVPNGNYEIKAHFDQETPAYDEFGFYVSWLAFDSLQQSQAYNRNVGGLRIKKITSFDQLGNSGTRLYKYNTVLNTDTSSGEIFGQPHFVVDDNTFDQSDNQCFALRADPNAISVTHSGSYIGYKKVFELFDTSGYAGMSEYNFLHATEGIVSMSPYQPAESQEYARGLPELVANYRFQGGTYFPVKRTYSEYEFKTYDSLKSVSYKLRTVQAPQEATPLKFGLWDDAFYYTTPAWSGLSKQTEINYDQTDTTKSLTVATDYSYNSANQLIQTKFINSKGDTIKSKMYYPKELSLTGSAETARQNLITQNNINAVLKQESLKNSIINKEVITNYKQFGSITMPEEVFVKTGTGASESRVKFLNYNSSGNLIGQQKTNDVLQSYIWGYGNKYPVAQIVGKSHDDAVSQSGINLTIVNNPSTEADLITELNKLRTLTDAFVTTYTYKPEIGISTETDPRGRTTYYYYDDFNRLSSVRDHDSKLLKQICYNYAGQAENCVDCVNTTANWQNTNEYSCQKNGSNENTGYQLRKQVDINPCSLTYGGFQWVVSSYNTTACPLPAPPIYARIELENINYGSNYSADVKIKFYSDAACTTPVSVSNLSVNYREYYDYYDNYGSSSNQYNYNINANGYEYVIGYNVLLEYHGGSYDESRYYEVLPGSNYLIP